MFKLMVLSVLVAVAAAKPGHSPLLATLVGEKTIESHGNSVVHASAPVVAAAPALVASPVIAESAVAYVAPAPVLAHAPPASVVKTKTIESHGNSVVHASAPLIAAVHSAPLIYTPYHAPATALVGQKTVTSYGHSIVHHGGPAIAHPALIGPALALY